jgi:hypothetical protein
VGTQYEFLQIKIVISLTFYLIGRMESYAWLGYSAGILGLGPRLGL